MASAMLLIDADLLLHRTTAVTERDIDWGDDVSTIHCDHLEMQTMAKREIAKIIAGCGLPHVKVVLVFSGERNFRKELDPSYKANRSGRKPVGYAVLKEWLFKNYECKVHNGIEADDLMAIMHTSGKLGKTVIVSDDKDMLQVPGLLYRPTAGLMLDISVTDGYRHHMYQTLTGDKADNYPGCPGMGEVGANKLLDAFAEIDWWPMVREAFLNKGLTEGDALLQARLSKILQFPDYDLKTRIPILWKPPSHLGASACSAEKTPPTPAPAARKQASSAPVASPASSTKTPSPTPSTKSPAPTRTKRTAKRSTNPTTTPSTE